MYYYSQAIWTVFRMHRDVLIAKLGTTEHRASPTVRYLYNFLENYLVLACDVIRASKATQFELWKKILLRLLFLFLRLGKQNYRDVILTALSKLLWWEKEGKETGKQTLLDELMKDLPSFSEIYVELFHAWLQRHRKDAYTAEQNQMLAFVIAVVGPQWEKARKFASMSSNMSYTSHLRTSHSKTEANVRGSKVFDETANWLKVLVCLLLLPQKWG